MTKVFVEQPMALPGSANILHDFCDSLELFWLQYQTFLCELLVTHELRTCYRLNRPRGRFSENVLIVFKEDIPVVV